MILFETAALQHSQRKVSQPNPTNRRGSAGAQSMPNRAPELAHHSEYFSHRSKRQSSEPLDYRLANNANGPGCIDLTESAVVADRIAA